MSHTPFNHKDKIIAKNEKMSKRIIELEQFVYCCTHDLKEPLRTLSGFTQLLLKRNADTLDAESVEYITHILKNISRMNTLITDIFSYSKITDEIKHLQAVNLNALISEIQEILAFRLEESNATMTIDHMPFIHGDSFKVKQIILNLLSNAIKFRSQSPLHISISAKTVGQSVTISICDNGIGIHEEYHQMVFEPFKRLNPQSLFEGSGIGLAIVKRNVEAHGGTIYAKSNPSGGTEFTFTLPCVRYT